MKLGSLCTGIGGAERALELMGLTAELVWYSEIDKAASELLSRLHPDVPNLGDLKQIDWHSATPIDVLVAGYPCQPFSTAGLRKGVEDERHLFPHIAKAIGVLRPRLAFFENVAAHLRLGFDNVLCDLAALGYDAQWGTLRASDIGAPHQRNRLFILATDASGQ
jgi:DNA (cytosine-5)-methyltransferase 1